MRRSLYTIRLDGSAGAMYERRWYAHEAITMVRACHRDRRLAIVIDEDGNTVAWSDKLSGRWVAFWTPELEAEAKRCAA